MAVNTCDDFLGVLQKSALLDAARLEEARRLVQGLSEPAAVARKLVQQNFLSRWQAQQILAGRHTLLISKYRLLDLMGNDAVGPSYLAEHKQMDRRVVLKALARREGNNSAAIEKFLSETATLATLDHRHLSHIYDVDHEGDFYYLVMEHVQGRNLQQVVETDGPLTAEAAAGLVALAADAMGHAHARGILHLGLRPDRLVVDGQGMLKVLDIGVARLADRESPDGSAIKQREALVYRAPEQLSGSGQPDARTDIYALGAILYLLLTGEHPAMGQSEPLDPRRKRADVPAELAQVCQKMTAPRPQDRFASAAEVANTLKDWLQHVETQRSSARAKAAAAKPRSGANGSEGAPVVAGADQPFPAGLPAATTASSSHPAVSRKSADQRTLMIGVGSGAVLAAIVAVAALFWRGSEPATSTPDKTPVAVTPATPQGNEQVVDDDEPVIERLKPVKISGPPKAKFLTQQDGSVLVDGPLPDAVEYRILLKCEQPVIDALRIDVLAHTIFGDGKAQPKPAQFRLSELKVETADNEDFKSPREVKLIQATADYGDPKTPAVNVIDGDRKTHWGTDAQADEDHAVTVWFDEPLASQGKDPQWLRVTLDQAQPGMRIYEFRVATVKGKRPEPSSDTVPDTPAGRTDELPVLAYWRFEKPGAPKGEAPASPAVSDASGSGNHLLLPEGAAAARFSPSVPAAKVRSTGAVNQQSLDDSQPVSSKDKTGAWGLVTRAARQPRDLASFKLDAWTVEASFWVDQLGFSHTILGKDGPPKAGSRAPLQLRVRGDNDRIEIEAVDSTGAPRSVESTAPVVPGRWYHVAAASDGKQLRLWVDDGAGGGLELQGGAPFTGPLAQGPGEWSVGRGFSDGKPADDALMLIDEVRISAAPLEPPQMLMYATPEQLAAEKVAPAAPTQTDSEPGKVKFHPLQVIRIEGPDGVEFQPQDDGSFLVQGTEPEKGVYTIRAHTKQSGIRGIRLEALADSRLPGGGPGRISDKAQAGNFVISAVSATASARESEPRPAAVTWSKATADVSQEKFDVTSLTDKNTKSGWGIAPAMGQGHYAMLYTERPISYPNGTWLTIKIEQNFGKKLTLGRFRVTAFTGTEPGEDPAAGVLAANRLADPLGKVPARVALPALPGEGESPTEETTEVVKLGTVYSSPAAPVELGLLGGESAFETEGNRFRLEPNIKDGSRRWRILMHTAEAAAADPVAVAEAAVVGYDLKFRWTEQGARSPLANQLRNCVLDVSVGDQRRAIALREPVQIPRLDMGFGKPAKALRGEIPWLPAAEGLKFSIPADQSDVPKYAVAPQDVPAVRGKCEITFGEAGQPALIAVVEASLKKSLTLEVDSLYQPSAEAKRIVYVRSKLDRLKAKLSSDVARGQVLLNAAKGPAKQQVEKQLQDVGAALQSLNGMLDMADEIEKAGGLAVQVYSEVGDHRVILAESRGE